MNVKNDNKHTMKVWANKRCERYSGGLILVAANSQEEAHKVFHDDERFGYMWYETEDEVYDNYYDIQNWKEVPNLVYNGTVPQVIDEAGYTD